MLRFRQFLNDYSWPLGLAALVVLGTVLVFGGRLVEDVAGKLRSSEWWAENILGFIIFTALVGWIVSLSQAARERRHRARFEGWKLVLKEQDGEHVQDLFWEEVERFQDSAFERWKFVKSLASGSYWITIPTIERAESGDSPWVVSNGHQRSITVDFGKAVENGHASETRGRSRPS